MANRSEATYDIAFTGAWDTTATPGGVPAGAHFSRLIGGVHNDRVVFLKSGDMASAGVESMAEVGGYTTLRGEVEAAGANRLSVIQGTTDSIGPTATRTFTDVTLTTDHPRVTLVTMIAPSPDWFVGVSGQSLLDGTGAWLESLTVNLYPWDAGTEDGAGFSLSNPATDPRENITSIRNTGLFSNERIATLTFTLQSTGPAAPTLDAVHAGDGGVAVTWTAPPGVTGIVSYDLRIIPTSADETVDGNWRVFEDVWSEGDLVVPVTSLVNGTGYDFQVRAVTDEDGAWSRTVAATPVEPGATRDAAAALPFNVWLPAELGDYLDVDFFRLTLTERAGVLALTRGDLDTYGVLYDSNGNEIASNDDGDLAVGALNFVVWATLDPGTYYVRVRLYPLSPIGGPYNVAALLIADTTGAGDAWEVEIDGIANGLIDPAGDEDYFTFSLGSETDVVLRSGPPVTDTVGELLNGSLASLETNDDGFLLGGEHQFLIREKLAAGKYYVKVRGFNDDDTGLYSFHVETVTEPGSDPAGARPLSFGEIGAGRIEPTTDADYFTFDLAEQRHIFLRGVSNSVDIDGAIVDSDGAAVPAHVHEQDFRSGGPKGFTVSDRLSAGTHYLKVTRSGGESTGGYAVRMSPDTVMDELVNDCSVRTPRFSDPLSGCQWHLRNRGQFAGAVSGEDIRVESVWSGGNLGAGINVAVVDDGVDGAHPDLADNFDEARSHDYTGHGQFGSTDHGTAVAGIVAARDNELGGRGVAPRAGIYSYNTLRAFVDENVADALGRESGSVGVSSNSWGLPDGPGLDPAPTAWETALETGVASGFGGKGIVYVWAGGNGYFEGDDSNFDGMANHYGVVAVCAVTDGGVRAPFSERGANLWVCGPSNGGRATILTTSHYGRYGSIGGTSAATPMVSGVVALVRSANEDLTWRDVKLILAGAARKNDSGNGGWRTGAARYGATGNYNFNREYGFGVVDASAAVNLADGWENVPAFIETDAVEARPNLHIPDAVNGAPGAVQTSTVSVGTEVEFVEFVEVVVDFDADAFRDLKVELVSPANTVSLLAPSGNHRDENGNAYGIGRNFRFGSAAHLGENPAGDWTLRVADEVAGNVARLDSWSVRIYGHRSRPQPPAIPFGNGGQRSLAVFWSAPGSPGASAITSYDVRWILSDAVDKADDRWTVFEGVSAAGALTYTVSGLLDQRKYDVQVRGVNAKGRGGWSRSATVETLQNRAPRPAGSLTAPDLRVGDGGEVLDVAAAFEDPEEDRLTYAASSSAPAVATASVSGSLVTLRPVGPGVATITVTATDIAGSNVPATQTFDVRVKGRRGVTISRDALTVEERSTGTYTVVLDSAPSGAVTVTPSAPANRNLSVDPASLEFTTGDWDVPKVVTVAAAADANANSEPPVTISHQVSGADYGSISAASVRVTIVETDTSVLSVEAVAAREAGGPATFEVTLSKESVSEITVDYATSDGSARAGSDYEAANGTLRFPAGSTASRRIAVNVIDDDEDEEEEETFRLTLRNARHASLAGGGSTLEVPGTIRDDDDPEVEVSFGSPTYGVTEGGTTDVAVRLDKDPERALEIFLESAHHGGATVADYSGVPRSVTFGPGVRRQEFLVAATDDIIDDDGEAVVLSFVSLPPRVTGDGRATIAIADNDGGGSAGGPPSGGGGGVGGGGGPPSGGGPPPGEAEDDGDDGDGGDGGDGGGVPGGGGTGGGGGPPRAAIATDAECEGTFCRVRAGARLSFRDASGGAVRSRLWDFGDGRRPRGASVSHAWSTPGFYDVTLTVSDGAVASIASLTFLVEAASPAGTCVADDRTRCLRDSRYAVTVDWWNAAAAGVGTVVHAGTDDSGMFQFFGASNWEVLVKVLDGCALNGHAWVFGASTTDLGYVIRVRDTATGAVKEYRNEPGVQAPAITDVRAFTACVR